MSAYRYDGVPPLLSGSPQDVHPHTRPSMPQPLEIDVHVKRDASGDWAAEVQPGREATPKVPRKDYALSRAALMTQIFQALLLVNGGGAIALLALLKEVVMPEKSAYRALAGSVAWGIILMGVGLLLAVFSAIARFYHSKEAEKLEYNDAGASLPTQRLYQALYVLLFISSALCFLTAIIVVGLPVLSKIET